MTRTQPKIGLLPLYLRLYQTIAPAALAGFTDFLAGIRSGLEAEQVGVTVAPVCCVETEFRAAVAGLEAAGVDALVTVHLAYSPSEEAIGALCASALPLLLLDATMDAEFGPGVDPARIMYNHGIHGVQDLASLLRRHRRPYRVVAGHVATSDVLQRTAEFARAARAAREFRASRVLRLGEAFRGMGDFALPEGAFGATLGMAVDTLAPADLAGACGRVTAEEIRGEMAVHAARFEVDLPADVHERSARVGLGVRRTLADGGYHAFSANFLAFDTPEPPVNAVPFLEASLAMERGVGYAGEGDALTAALVGSLERAFGRTTFTEIFCPDWRGGRLFLSHMGEMNPEVMAGRPRLSEKPYAFSGALSPAILTGPVVPGPATLVNLVPGPDGTFGLVVAPLTVEPEADNPALAGLIRAWVRPALPVAPFLERYSEHGGTHHSALILGDHTEAMSALAWLSGWDCAVIA